MKMVHNVCENLTTNLLNSFSMNKETLILSQTVADFK